MTGSAPQPAVPAAQVGLVATRSIVIPFYARRSQGDLEVSANLAAFGYGMKSGQSALRAFPSTQAAKSANVKNYGKTFTLKGSVAAPNLEAALPGWSKIVLNANPSSVTNPPPYFPGFSNTWVPQGTDRLSSYAACLRPNCSEVW